MKREGSYELDVSGEWVAGSVSMVGGFWCMFAIVQSNASGCSGGASAAKGVEEMRELQDDVQLP